MWYVLSTEIEWDEKTVKGGSHEQHYPAGVQKTLEEKFGSHSYDTSLEE